MTITMMERPIDSRAGEAFRRLLADASANEQARVDALVAFSQRTVWVATWEPTNTAWRTIEHEDGSLALPVFSDEWELDRAATELEWNGGNAKVTRREIGAREAMRQVIEQQYPYLVIDLASAHCVEASRGELEPLASPRSRSESQGPYAAVGRITNTMIEAVRSSQTMGAVGSLPPSANEKTRTSSSPPRSSLFGGATPNGDAPGGRSGSSLPPARVSSAPPPQRGPSVTPPLPWAAVAPATPGSATMPARPGAFASLPVGRSPSGVPATPAAGTLTPAMPPRAPSMVPSGPLRGPSVSPQDPLRAGSFMPLRAAPSAVGPSMSPSSSGTTGAAGSLPNDSGVTLSPVLDDPNDAFLDALCEALKRFPEVEWASYCIASIEGQPEQPTIGLRIDVSFRTRVTNISAAIAGVADAHGVNTAALLLDQPALMRQARADGIPFHPWRRRKTGSFSPL